MKCDDRQEMGEKRMKREKYTGKPAAGIIAAGLIMAMAAGLCACASDTAETAETAATAASEAGSSTAAGSSAEPEDSSSSAESADSSAAAEADTTATGTTAEAAATADTGSRDVTISLIEAGKYKDGSRVIDDDLYFDKKITLHSDKTYTLEQYGYNTVTGAWDSLEKNTYTLYSDTSDDSSGITAPEYDICPVSGADGSYYLKPEGSDEADWTLALDTATEDGAAALDLQNEQLGNISGSNEETSYVSPAFISVDCTDNNGTYLMINDVVLLNKDNPARCRLYGRDPKEVEEEVIIDNDPEGYSYYLDDNATCSYIDYDHSKVVKCTAAKFLKHLKDEDSLLVRATTFGTTVTGIEEIE